MANTTNKKMNENAEKIMNFLNAHKGEAFTFAEINEALGLNLKSTGSFTRFMKSEKNPDGVICHGAQKEVKVTITRKVNTYIIPADTEETSTDESEEPTK